MSKKLNAFTISTLNQAEDIILEAKTYKIRPILHFKHYILRGFGSEFILTFQKKLKSKFGNSSFKIFIDCGFDSSLSIKMATKKIDYIKLRGDLIILKKVKHITDKNRVLLNPSFNIVDCRNLKNINLQFKKLYFRKKHENRREPN